MRFTKMDKIWVATALLLKGSTRELVSRDEILQAVERRFNTPITPVMVTHHLVSWVDRQVDKVNPSRGGSRNRYLFRTEDGRNPSEMGCFRLYTKEDVVFDGGDKTGKTHPRFEDIPQTYHYLLDWYLTDYWEG